MKKKEQFSLQLWDRLKQNNIPHTFETREGSKITELTQFNSNVKQPIVGHDTNDKDLMQWNEDGSFYDSGNSGLDLFIVWEEDQLMLEGWFNIYTDNFLSFYCEKKEADKHATQYRIACVKVSIPYTKGEGLGDG